MKKTLILAALATTLVTAQSHAADNNSLTTTQDFKTLTTAPAAETTSMAAPAQTPVQATTPAPQKKTILKGGAHIVPDTANASSETFKKSHQGYSKMSAYNVVNDQNKPVTQDWTRPQSWRIGYKNKNRTPINE